MSSPAYRFLAQGPQLARAPTSACSTSAAGPVPRRSAGAGAGAVARLDLRHRARDRRARRTLFCSQCWQASPRCAAPASLVRVTPAWDEPLVLWLALVGEPSTGKSAALAPMRRLLERRRAGAAARATRSGAPRHAERVQGRAAKAPPFVPSQVVADGRRSTPLLADIVGRQSARRAGEVAAAWSAARRRSDCDRATWLAAVGRARAVTVARPRQPRSHRPAIFRSASWRPAGRSR